jgi:uncharacterized NAD(P)/FAD-binding protein YdhS
MDGEMPILDTTNTIDTAHERTPVVAIVGGGCAGTLVAANLLRRFDGPLRIVMIERSGRFGPGMAYATEDPQHLLNVPAQNMSAFCEEPSHFADWAAQRLGGSTDGASYLPRRVYGEYLRAVLADSRARAEPQRTLQLLDGEVVGLRRTRTGVDVLLAGATNVACDRVVLATGPFEGDGIAQLPADPRIVTDPWAPCALHRIDGSPGGPGPSTGLTLIVGSGLTAVDVTLSICAQGGQVLALSRGGRLPYAQLPGLRAPAPPPEIPPGSVTLAKLEHAVREHVSDAQRQGYGWRDAIDGLRPLTPGLWDALDPGERRRFLRERLRAWEIRRHRMAPAVGARLRELLDSGRMTLSAGSVLAARTNDDGLEVDVAARTSDGGPEVGGATYTSDGDTAVDATHNRSTRIRTLVCERVVVCAGAGTDIERSANPLLRALLADGLASPDPLGLGLRTDADGALRDRNGYADGRVLTLGALRRGELWETTAAQEIRAQAEHLARTIEQTLHTLRDAPDRRDLPDRGLAAHTENRLDLTTRPPIPSGR